MNNDGSAIRQLFDAMHEITELEMNMDRLEYRSVARAMRRIDPDGDMDCFHEAWIESHGAVKYPIAALVRIAKFRAIDERRRRQFACRLARTVAAQLSPPRAGLTSSAEFSEDSFQLRRAVAHLPDRYREAIELRYLAEMSPTEIAGRMRCPRSSVYTRIRRGIEMLREDPDLAAEGARP